MNKLLTVVIPTYRSEKLVLSHLKNLHKTYKIIIIENSYDKSLKNKIENKYKNVDIFLKKNIGFGRALNFAAKKVKTKYFISINPDATLFANTLKNLIKAANKIDNFGSISPVIIDKKSNKKNIIIETRKVNGPIMLFKTKTFITIDGFDKNIFLYYEENDYFTKCNILDLKLYLISNSYYNHTNSKKDNKSLSMNSVKFTNLEEKNSTYCVAAWHGNWSKFYYLRKYNGYFKAFIMCLPHILLTTIQMIFCLFFNFNKAKHKYYKIEGFVCAALSMPSFKRSKYDKKNIFNLYKN
jgi:N-acetylglucosaminyl-diphospho-decaprenol L-rhamnosyltransferase